MSMSSVRLALVLLVAAGAAPASLVAQQASTAATIATRSGYRISSWRHRGVDHHNRLQLVRAAMTGAPDGMILFATEMGATGRVIQAVAGLGAEIMARFDEVGYFRARLPLREFAAAEALPGVLMVLIEGGALSYSAAQGMVRYLEPRKSKPDSIRADSVAKDSVAKENARTLAMPAIPPAAFAPETPYVAMNDMRSYDLRRRDPRFDGRGVTVAVLEYGTLDFLHPALQEATALDGSTVRKIRGVITPFSYDPDFVKPTMLVGGGAYASFDTRRVRRTQAVTVTNGTFTAGDSTWRAPDGSYSFGLYRAGKIPRGVIWDEAKRLAWVDANGDRSFLDEAAMQDINVVASVGTLAPLDSTAADPKRSVRFAIAFDSIPGMLRIYEGTQGHQTMVATVAAGRGILGVADASAPGAQVMIVDAGLLLYSYLEAWARAARDPRVDVITSSQVGEVFLSGGDSFLALILNRLVEVHGKPFFASAHNSGPMSTSGGEAAAIPRVMSIGGYVGAATYAAHYGWTVPDQDYLIAYSSRGPSTNGGAKPDVVASVLSVSGGPCLALAPARTPIYRFPDCYRLGGGTSSSSPHAAGVATLLISAARQSGLPDDARHITWAMRMGARFLPNYPAHEQGAGLLDAVRAYELLQIVKQRGLHVPDIETRAPNRTRLAKYLREPGFGGGLFEREGWQAGDVGVRTIRLTRRTGPAGPVTYGLGWRGNNGTFSTPGQTVTLPLNAPVDVAVRVAPKTSGMHSAHLLLIDRATALPMHHVLATVVAADRFTSANGHRVSYAARVPWPRAASYFIDIPEGTASLRLDLAVSAGRVRLSTSDAMMDRAFLNRASSRPYRYRSTGARDFIYPDSSGTHVIADPEPGVMELLVEPYGDAGIGRDSAQFNVPSAFTLTASIQRASGTVVPAVAATNGAYRAPVAFTNHQGALGDPRIAAEVGVRRILRGTTGGQNLPAAYFVNVDSGTTTLRVAAVTGAPGAELALYLYDCAAEACALWDVAMRDGRRQELLVVKPRPGAWKVVIDAVRPVGGTLGFTYTEILTHPGLGAADPSTARIEAGATSLGTSVTFVPAGAPRIGYDRVGVVDLFDEAVEQAETRNPIGKFPDHLPAFRPVRIASVVVPLRSR